jgi:hypothetical protein
MMTSQQGRAIASQINNPWAAHLQKDDRVVYFVIAFL